MKKTKNIFKGLLLLLVFSLYACTKSNVSNVSTINNDNTQFIKYDISDISYDDNINEISETKDIASTKFSTTDIPDYRDAFIIDINNNMPFFNSEDMTINSFEKYSDLDELGRCGVAYACIGKDLMPTEERGNIGSVKPTGWHTVKYAGIDGNYLYNRCHLIAYCLTGENANKKNLITGTRYLNTEGMLPIEIEVSNYIKKTNNHVLYRVTPIFENNNLLAKGVLIEALSVEDNGTGIKLNKFIYNIQPGVTINYQTGDSSGPEYIGN